MRIMQKPPALENIQGGIFDLDDTLLDNGPPDKPEEWLHSRSRLAAIHKVGEELGVDELRQVTPQENVYAFIKATEHTLAGAIWNIFYQKGLVKSEVVDVDHERYATLLEIARLKNELHGEILRQYGQEIPGSTSFVRALATQGSERPLAMATQAIERDIEIYLEITGLQDVFPWERIVSHTDISLPKPHPQSYNLAFECLGLPDSARPQTPAFEDHPRGVRAAKAAGLYVCAIATRYDANSPELLSSEPDLIANDYHELAAELGLKISGS